MNDILVSPTLNHSRQRYARRQDDHTRPLEDSPAQDPDLRQVLRPLECRLPLARLVKVRQPRPRSLSWRQFSRTFACFYQPRSVLESCRQRLRRVLECSS